MDVTVKISDGRGRWARYRVRSEMSVAAAAAEALSTWVGHMNLDRSPLADRAAEVRVEAELLSNKGNAAGQTSIDSDEQMVKGRGSLIVGYVLRSSESGELELMQRPGERFSLADLEQAIVRRREEDAAGRDRD